MYRSGEGFWFLDVGCEMTQGDVRLLQSMFATLGSAGKLDVAARRLSVAGYLHQLAEEVRVGAITSFSVGWDGENAVDAEVASIRPSIETDHR